MRAVCWRGPGEVEVEDVPDPKTINPRDAIVAVSSAGICEADMDIFKGHAPAMREGDILGNEFMGEVVDVGAEVRQIKVGDRVVVPFVISCGACWYCKREEWSLCDNTNPNAWMAEKMFGQSPAGSFGSSHLFGGYAGGQAEYVRVPFADVGCLKIEEDISDSKVLFLSNSLPTAYMAVEQSAIQAGDVVAVWGCGPLGQLAIRCAYLFEPSKVVAIDNVSSHLRMAREQGADVVELRDGAREVLEEIKEMTAGRGPDVIIHATGRGMNGHGLAAAAQSLKSIAGFDGAAPSMLRESIRACRKGGRLAIASSSSASLGRLSLWAHTAKTPELRAGRAHVHRYMRPLLDRIRSGQLDTSFMVTHKLVLSDAPAAYELCDRAAGCVKVVLEP